MNDFSWETLQQFVGKERFTLAEAIKALIDNQTGLSDDDLAHIIAILFKFEVAPDNCLVFTTFDGLLKPSDLSEARQIIKDYKQPMTIDDKRYYFFDGLSDLVDRKIVGIDKAKEGGDSIVIVVKQRGEVLGKETKLPLFLRSSKK